MSKYHVCLNYDRNDVNELAAQKVGSSNYMVPTLLEKAFSKHPDVTVYTRSDYMDKNPEKVDIVINCMPMNGMPFLQNSKGLTAWWDLEECSEPRREYYPQSDIIFHPNYNPYRHQLYPKEKASYLPLANDFDVSRYFPEEPVLFDIAFLGREELEIYERRRRILDLLERFWTVKRGRVPRGEMSSRVISQGRLTIQISGWDNLEERFFQFGAIRPMLVDYLEELDLVAKRDVEYISFTHDKECLEKVEYYLDHPEEAEKIFQAQLKNIKENHTYENRVEEILRILDGGELNHVGWHLWDKAAAEGYPTEYPQ